jgi:hypothetical protein
LSKASLILLLFIAAYCTVACGQILPNGSDFAGLTGNYSDKGIDINGDGKFEYLNIDVGIHIEYPGEYSLNGYLYDRNDKEVVWSVDHRNFTYGDHTMQLAFDGKTIQKRGLNGPYRLGNLSFTWGSATIGLIPCARLDDAYETAFYNSSDFVDPISTDKILSGSGKGEILLTLAIETIVPTFSGRYMYDIVGLNIPPLSMPVEIIGLDPKKFPRGGYDYRLQGMYIPGKPNNFTIIARGVKNLNVGLMKLQGNRERTWVSSQFMADESAIAKAETDLISPNGSYHVKIFGDSLENETKVDLQMTVVKKLIVDGPFDLLINTTGFPEGNYSYSAKALNGSFSFDELNFRDADVNQN